MTWIKTENGGYSDTGQKIEWKKILEWQYKMFLYSNYLYYVMDNPKLDDANYDTIVRILENHIDEIDDERLHALLEGNRKIKPVAFELALQVTEQEIAEAIDWKNNQH